MWFTGGVAAAVTKSRTEKKIFMVYVRGGDDDKTIAMDCHWDDSELKEFCRVAEFVCLKLENDSESAKQFGQIYPILNVPVTYFINGMTGKPLHVVFGKTELSDLKKVVQEVFKKHDRALTEESSGPSTAKTADASEPQHDDESVEARMQRARDQLARRREEKEQKEKEDQVRRETDRREMGKSMTASRDKRENEEARALVAERRAAKQADAEAYRKIKEQIAADRAEKAERFGQVQRTDELARHGLRIQKDADVAAKQQEDQAERNKYARIQFRLPDQPPVAQSFESERLLSDLYVFVRENYGLEKFSLVQAYPRREFGDVDKTKSLADLQLVPSAVIAVVPFDDPQSKNKRLASNENFLSWIVRLFLMPLTLLYTIVGGLFMGGRRGGMRQPPVQSTSANKTNANTATTSAGFSQQGEGSNVVRMRNRLDDEDEKPGSWNGNSTQQL